MYLRPSCLVRWLCGFNHFLIVEVVEDHTFVDLYGHALCDIFSNLPKSLPLYVVLNVQEDQVSWIFRFTPRHVFYFRIFYSFIEHSKFNQRVLLRHKLL